MTDKQKADLVDRVVAEVHQRLDDEPARLAEIFLRAFYRRVPADDLLDEPVETLLGGGLALWRFAERRAPDTAKVRVYNPRPEEHGWRSHRTVIEAVNDDMPFLIDSVTAILNDEDLEVHKLIHPVLAVTRDAEGRLVDFPDADGESGGATESMIQVEATRQSDEAALTRLADRIEDVLADTRAAVDDWQAMHGKLSEVIDDLETPPANLPEEAVADVKAFLAWIRDGNFTFLGYQDCAFVGPESERRLRLDPERMLGVLTRGERPVFDRMLDGRPLPVELRAFVHRPDVMMVTKANLRSTVHRAVHTDTLCVKYHDDEGRVIGQHVFVGLFTASVYNQSPRGIPYLSGKVHRLLEAAGLPLDSHDGKVLLNVLETFPRDELFQIGDSDLLSIAQGIVHLQQRPRVALFLRRDDFGRFISCLVFVPRDRYTTALRFRIQDILVDSFKGEVAAYYIQINDTPLARVHVILRTNPDDEAPADIDPVEQRIVDAARAWPDHLRQALVGALGEERGLRLFARYGAAFPPGYSDQFSADAAVTDIERLEQARDAVALVTTLYRPITAPANHVRLKIYHPGGAVPLSDALPILEHMGFRVIDEVPFAIRPADGDGDGPIMIHDFGLRGRDGNEIDLGALREPFKEAFGRVWAGEAESDGFNALVLSAGLSWRQVVVLRAYCKYLRQTAIPFSQAYMEQTLVGNREITRLIINLFQARFDPAREADRGAATEALLGQVTERLEAVASADEDRILKRFVNLVESTLRTNFYQPGADGDPKPYLSFKLNSQAIEDLPLPRPWREVFVYSARTEGIHLRGGPVARGGLRWSDRLEDFRTEVLGLMKAQQVKNAVIVPVGSKGGFVVKRPPVNGGRQALLDEGIACYRNFIRGLLDLTDNRVGDGVTAPRDVVRHDADDPYLVVAADKGTATFSDIANGVAADYEFWLGDAFASGGSLGYDHKKMGITAKGAWESVKRHFREIGVNTQAQDFTVAGVGDMGGDVFGNGMLLSPHIRLVAAFNHLHIFLDPDPDPETSFAERRRLFDSVRGWDAYDTALLSSGGAIFRRTVKRIVVTPEIRALLGLTRDSLTPSDLVRAILAAPVDLLWFGGIGTYVKASHETHPDAGDRANDAVRINAADLRCKVIGEGANLGLTQPGRIEFALRGGRLNTDSIDNSAGVDCSDHEVNIKILLDKVVADGDLTAKQRNALLVEMTDEVGDLVLRDNYLQTQAIGVVARQGNEVLDQQTRLMRMLERAGRLDRAVEHLPDDETLAERDSAGIGLTRPEISILMPYSKIWLFDQIKDSDLPDDPFLAEDLVRYFPSALRERFRAAIDGHRLRREIIATHVTNSMINRVGGYFVTQILEKTGVPPAQVARAYLITRAVFGLRDLWAAIEALDNRVPADVQTSMMLEVNRLIDRSVLWFLRHGQTPLDIGRSLDMYGPGVSDLTARLDSVLAENAAADLRRRTRDLCERGVPDELARRVAGLIVLVSGCDIVRLGDRHRRSVDSVARHYFALGGRLRLGYMRASAERLKADTHWTKLAVGSMIEDLYGLQMTLASRVLGSSDGPDRDASEAIEAWVADNQDAVSRTEQMLAEMWAGDTPDFPMLAVASRQLRTLADQTDPASD